MYISHGRNPLRLSPSHYYVYWLERTYHLYNRDKNNFLDNLFGRIHLLHIQHLFDYGYYWSGTIHKEDNKSAWLLNFDMVDNKYGLAGGSRHFGLSVRPVYGMPVKITMTTGSASSITATSAIVSGKVEGVSSAITVGVIYGRSSTLSETSGTKKSTTSSGTFSITLPNLNSETTYYYRVYAVIDDIYYFGEVKNFTTKEMTYAIGDYYPNSTSPEGVVFYTYSNGTHGKIFSIEHGRGTWYEATKWAESLGTGWYLPSKSELSTIASHYANYSYMFEGFYWSSTKQASGYYSNYYLVCIGDWIQYYNGQVIYNTETERNSCFAIKSF